MSRSQLLPLGRYAQALQADSHLKIVLFKQAAPHLTQEGSSHRLRANNGCCVCTILVTIPCCCFVDAAQHNIGTVAAASWCVALDGCCFSAASYNRCLYCQCVRKGPKQAAFSCQGKGGCCAAGLPAQHLQCHGSLHSCSGLRAALKSAGTAAGVT